MHYNSVITYIYNSTLIRDECYLYRPVLVSGPALPPGYKRREVSSSSDESEQEVAVKRAKTSQRDADRSEK